ncbi:MAG: aldehyde ferredoxin oxidoreductase C-terminal domain-containing protein, partial [Deltaproteobacteria bacterium]|nr:aldehyde ferredoxin oxidoreductase C-terminal domain-containing protein [Deltaproteobacteria bacterium]
DDIDIVMESGLFMQKAGIDVVTAISVIRWLMELYEKGLITEKDTDGVAMKWGSRDAIMSMLEKMSERKGVGNVLADGLAAAAEHFGKDTEQYAYHSKGLALYAVPTPNLLAPFKDLALASVAGSRGDTLQIQLSFEHYEGLKEASKPYDASSASRLGKALRMDIGDKEISEKTFDYRAYEGTPEVMIYADEEVIINDCLSTCKLRGFHLPYPFSERYQAELFSAGLGREVSADKLFAVAGRVKNLERAFCARRGMTRETDSLGEQFFKEIKSGSNKGISLSYDQLEKMKDRYYELKGWDIKTGIPTRETLEKSGLKDVADDLEKEDKLP